MLRGWWCSTKYLHFHYKIIVNHPRKHHAVVTPCSQTTFGSFSNLHNSVRSFLDRTLWNYQRRSFKRPWEKHSQLWGCTRAVIMALASLAQCRQVIEHPLHGEIEHFPICWESFQFPSQALQGRMSLKPLPNMVLMLYIQPVPHYVELFC